jgi:hypothetical protein
VFITKEEAEKQSKSNVVGLGYHGFHCSQMYKSLKTPINANSVRVADINVIAAMGDSLTVSKKTFLCFLSILFKAGFKSGADGLQRDYRGLSFSAGGDYSLEKHITLPSMDRNIVNIILVN